MIFTYDYNLKYSRKYKKSNCLLFITLSSDEKSI